MLADDMLQLLTAYVDGELNPRQRHDVLRLLHQSSEAREILRQLQENLHKVQQLPRRHLEPGFAKQVMSAITDRQVQVTPVKPVRRTAPTLLRWLPVALVATAAAVLFMVTLGGVLYFAAAFVGIEQALVNPPENPIAEKREPVVPEPPKQGEGEPQKKPQTPRPLNPMIAKLIEGTFQQYATPLTPERASGYAFRDLTKEPVARQVAAELKKSNALELQVTARSNQQAMERLQRVLQKHDIRLVIDPATATALQNAGQKTELFVYADNLKADEVAKILKELAAEEKKTANPFDTVTVAALSASDQQKVRNSFGKQWDVRNDPDRKKGLQGKNPKPNAKPPTRIVAVLPPGPQTTLSDQMRQFLLQRADPGSLRVLVRIRQP